MNNVENQNYICTSCKKPYSSLQKGYICDSCACDRAAKALELDMEIDDEI